MSSPSFVARLAAAAIVSVAASSAASAQGTFTYLPGPAYDVSADGQRFLVNTVVETAAPSPITLVVNWTSALRAH